MFFGRNVLWQIVMGRVVYRANCPWGDGPLGQSSMGLIVHGANRPWSELSMGQNVHEAKYSWGKWSWGNVHGTSRDGQVVQFLLKGTLDPMVNLVQWYPWINEVLSHRHTLTQRLCTMWYSRKMSHVSHTRKKSNLRTVTTGKPPQNNYSKQPDWTSRVQWFRLFFIFLQKPTLWWLPMDPRSLKIAKKIGWLSHLKHVFWAFDIKPWFYYKNSKIDSAVQDQLIFTKISVIDLW